MKYLLLPVFTTVCILTSTLAFGTDAELQKANSLARTGEYGRAQAAWTSLCEQGNAEACVRMAQFLDSVRQSSYDWYVKASALGHADAQFVVASTLDRAAGNDATKLGEALALYVAAADQGHEKAKLAAGLVYFGGPAGVRDYKKAMGALLPFAHAGNVDAENAVGVMFYLGEGVTKDATQAMAWFRKAAEAGDPQAQFSLGVGYLQGEGLARDPKAANQWLDLAGQAGVPQARQAQLEALSELHEATGRAERLSTVTDDNGRVLAVPPSSRPKPFQPGSYSTKKGRKTFNSNGIGTYVMNDKVCYRFRWTYDTTRVNVIHTVRLAYTAHCDTQGAEASWMEVETQAGFLSQVDVPAGESAFGATVAPDPALGDRVAGAAGDRLTFRTDGTGTWAQRNGLTDRMNTHTFHWAHDITRPGHVHLVDWPGGSSRWRRLAGPQLKSSYPGSSWMTHDPATPGTFEIISTTTWESWSLHAGGGGTYSRPEEPGFGGPGMPACNASFKWAHATDGTLTLSDVSDGCLGLSKFPAFRFQNRFYFAGQSASAAD